MTWLPIPGSDGIYTRTQIPPEALDGIEHARDRDYIVVRNTYENWRAMRARGLVVPPPLEGFRFRGRHSPRKHQRDGIGFLLSHQRCALLHPTGSGKTLTAAWAMDYLFSHNAIQRALIVAPKSVCGHVWGRELFTEFPHLRSAVAAKDAEHKRKLALDASLKVVVCNYESLHTMLEGRWDLVIADESTRVKNAQTRNWGLLNALSRDRILWLMTGTPTPQSPLDAYGMIKLLRGPVLTFTRWKNMVMRQVTPFKWVPVRDAHEQVSRWLQPSLYVAAEECYDVPEVETFELEYDLTPKQTRMCTDLVQHAITELEGKPITAANAAHVLTKLLQVQAGGVYDSARQTHLIDAEPFYAAVEDFVEAADTPVLIFCSYLPNAKALHERLSKQFDIALVIGDTTPVERSRAFDGIQAKTLKAIVAVPTTMSHGITLTAARHVLWVTPPFSNETYMQSNARVIRQGQRNAVRIWHMVSSKTARRLFTRLDERTALQDAVLDLITEQTHG